MAVAVAVAVGPDAGSGCRWLDRASSVRCLAMAGGGWKLVLMSGPAEEMRRLRTTIAAGEGEKEKSAPEGTELLDKRGRKGRGCRARPYGHR